MMKNILQQVGRDKEKGMYKKIISLKKPIVCLLSLLAFAGCSEVFEPEVDEVEPFLVVEGSISTQPGLHFVTLSYSGTYAEYPYFPGEDDAIVLLRDQNGSSIAFENLNRGIYRLNITAENQPFVGNSYRLHVFTPEGDEFISTPQEIVPSPDITGLFCKFDTEFLLTEDAYGSVRELEFEGLNVFLETEGRLPSDNYYIYKYVAYEQHHSVIRFGINNYHIYRHRRLSGKYSAKIHTVNADEFGDKKVRNNKLMFIAKPDIVNYQPIFPDTFEFVATNFEGLIFKLEQYSLSADAYKFYSDVENQLAAEGRMFDPANPQVTGNMSCSNDSLEKVLGVFSASDVSERIAYFHINYRNHTHTMDMDSLPELWLDTCSWGQPSDWIRPPF